MRRCLFEDRRGKLMEEAEEFELESEEEILRSVNQDLNKLSLEVGIDTPEYHGFPKAKSAQNRRIAKTLKASIPEGRLFHPSCGEDKTSLKLFEDAITGVDFSDPFQMPKFNSKELDVLLINKRNPNSLPNRIGSMGNICLPKSLPDISDNSCESFVRQF